ncbi:MAG TPA: DUF2071 domain-containing protein [Polyangiaceae bacterium]
MIDRLGPGRRPEGAASRGGGSQKWRSLLFLHWEVPVAPLQALVPEGLTVDTFEGRAYVGLVAFTMKDVRPSRRLPAVPTARDFHELNVRTYVHRGGRDPGVWFFSLDAASALAVLAARAFFHLPYFHARMHMRDEGDGRWAYRARRHWASDEEAAFEARYEVGDDRGTAAEGTLEHFLVERYLLFAETPRGALVRGQVHHRPYPLRRARVTELRESMVKAAGLRRPEDRVSELWSEGVDVEVFRLQRVERGA